MIPTRPEVLFYFNIAYTNGRPRPHPLILIAIIPVILIVIHILIVLVLFILILLDHEVVIFLPGFLISIYCALI